MYRIAGLFALMLASSPALACSIEEVARQIQFAAIQRAAELSGQQIPLLKRFNALGDKAKEPGKPLNQQLSQADLAEFAQLQQRYQSIELLQLLESDYERDNHVIRDMFEVAQAQYLGAPVPKEGDKNFVPYAFLALMTLASQDEQIKSKLITVPDMKVCTMEVAIHEIENESFGRMNKLPIPQAEKELSAMRVRNGVTKIDRDKLNSSDRSIFDRIQRTAYAPGIRENSFVADLESLKLLARTAALKFELSKKDAIDSGGDINSVGKSIDALDLDMRARMGLNMLNKIGEKFPSDWLKQKEQMAPAIAAIKKQDAARMSKKK